MSTATRIQKIFWSLLCGSAVGIMGCGESSPSPSDTGSDLMTAYGPADVFIDEGDVPEDTEADSSSDAYDAADEDEETIVNLYGPPSP